MLAIVLIVAWPPKSLHSFAPLVAVALLPLIPLIPISLGRVEVDDDEIRVRKFGKIGERVRFEEVGYSHVSVLAESNHPVTLTIFAKVEEAEDENQEPEDTELMTVGLKILRKEDVAWLLSLPQLKILGYRK